MNNGKSGVFFSKNTTLRQKKEIKIMLGMKEVNDKALYLGNPMMIGWSKFESFEFFKNKIYTRLARWKNKVLSLGGKVILLK